MEEHLGRERHERSNETNPNYRNGYSSKTIESSFGEVGLDIPRDRKAQFEPKIVKKYENVCNELEVSESRVCQLHSRAIKNLRVMLQKINYIEV